MLLEHDETKNRCDSIALWVLLFTAVFSWPIAAQDFDRWSRFDAASKNTVNHEPLTLILNYVTFQDKKKEQIAYFLINEDVIAYLDSYLHYLQSADVSGLPRNEQLAYWLNLHNAGALRLIAGTKNGHRKVKSLHGEKALATPWLHPSFRVEEQSISLANIEFDILGRHWQDPAIIYGLYVGATGGPQLGRQAFAAATVHADLAERGLKFVNSASNVRSKRKGFVISSVYDWHKDSLFNGSDRVVLDHIASLAKPRLAKKIDPDSQIASYQFNWRTNAMEPRAARSGIGGIGGTSRSGGGS